MDVIVYGTLEHVEVVPGVAMDGRFRPIRVPMGGHDDKLELRWARIYTVFNINNQHFGHTVVQLKEWVCLRSWIAHVKKLSWLSYRRFKA